MPHLPTGQKTQSRIAGVSIGGADTDRTIYIPRNVFAIRKIAFLYSGLLNSRHAPLTKAQFIMKRFLGRVIKMMKLARRQSTLAGGGKGVLNESDVDVLPSLSRSMSAMTYRRKRTRMALWNKKRAFLLPFGLPLEGQRCGAAAKGFNEGYNVEGIKNAPYNYGFVVIVSRERIFPLFIALSAFVTSPCVGVLIDHLTNPRAAYTSDVDTKKEILDAFTRHSFQLVNDGFVSFGISSDKIEIMVEDHKNFMVFCKSSSQVMKVLEEYGIPMGSKINWVKQAAHVHVPTIMLFEDHEVKKVCEPIPEEEVEKFESNPEAYKKFFQEIVERLQMGIEE